MTHSGPLQFFSSVTFVSQRSGPGKWLLWPGFRVKVQQRDDFNENGYSFACILLESVDSALLERGR